MAVSTPSFVEEYLRTDNTTGPYTVPFQFLDVTDLRVAVRLTTGAWQTLGDGQYTVTRNADTQLGSVSVVTALAPPFTRLRVMRVTPARQNIEFPLSGPFPAKGNERGLDRAIMILQEQAYRRTWAREVFSPAESLPADETRYAGHLFHAGRPLSLRLSQASYVPGRQATVTVLRNGSALLPPALLNAESCTFLTGFTTTALAPGDRLDVRVQTGADIYLPAPEGLQIELELIHTP